MSAAPFAAATDAAPWLPPKPPPSRGFASMRRSLHVTMRDGVRLAVDVHLPVAFAHGQRLPTILRQTCYYRGIDYRSLLADFGAEWLLDATADCRKRFLASGYAWVDVCVRGSGASFGTRPCPSSPDEIADGRDVVEWIVSQPWSNGLVGATGISYDGSTSELLLGNGHPAVRAAAPRFCVWDIFADVAFPGGIHLATFTERWATFNALLDSGAFAKALGLMTRLQIRAARSLLADTRPGAERWLARLDTDRAERALARLVRAMARGVRPVDGDEGGRLLAAALAEHAENVNVHESASRSTFRDDPTASPALPGATVDLFSPHAHAAGMEASGAAIYAMSGWLDGYVHSAVKRFHRLRATGARLVLGPWDHGGLQNTSPYCSVHESAFDQHGELVRFFDRHLTGGHAGAEPRVRYFTVGQERWKDGDAWPPPAERQVWWLGAERGLVRDRPGRARVDEHVVDHDVGTGHRARWDSLLLLLAPVGYSRREEIDRRLLVYRSAPLDADLEVTGHPVVSLWVTADASDAHVFVYLEDELPSGRVELVTEGQLRALHRRSEGRDAGTGAVQRTFLRADGRVLVPGEATEFVFDLLPTSWQFAQGHRLRLAISGADADHFVVMRDVSALGIHVGGERASRIELPVPTASG